MKYTDYYHQYKHKIFSYFFYNLAQDRNLAEDLSSETFLKGFEKFENFDHQYQFSTRIFTIARNTLYDYYRRAKIEIHVDDDLELSHAEYIKYENEIHKQIDNQAHMQEVYNAMRKIPEKQREMLVMKYLDEFSTKEISHLTGKSEANIRKILSRWIEKLSQILKPLSD